MSLACSYCGAPQPDGTVDTSRCFACGRPLTEPDFGADPDAVLVDGPLQLDDNRPQSFLGVDRDGKPALGPPPAFDQPSAAQSPAMQTTMPDVQSAPPLSSTEPDVGAEAAAASAYTRERGESADPDPLDEVTFPGDELSLYLAWRWLWLKRQPAATRIPMLAAMPLLLLVLVSIPYCIGASVAAPEAGSVPAVVYLQQTHPLLRRPRLEPVERSLGRLDRGARLIRYERISDYVLVRDFLGRSGYVLAASLGPEPPPSLPEKYGFPDCAPGYGERGTASCKARAQQAGAECHTACPRPVADTCEPLCDLHLAKCLAACDDPPPDGPPAPACKKSPTAKGSAAGTKPKKKHRKKRR